MHPSDSLCHQTSSRRRGRQVLRVPLEREPPDTTLTQLLVDDVMAEREVLQVTGRLGQSQGEVPRELNELGTCHQQLAELQLALLDAHILDVLRFEAVLPALVRVEVADLRVVQVGEFVDIEVDGEPLPIAHQAVVEEEGNVGGS